MTDCVFCKIVQGKIPCCKVYEDSTILAFMDISPINVGHVLIIPKKHCESLIESGDKILQAMLPVAAMIVNSLKRVNNKSINTKEEAWKKQVVKADAVNLLLSGIYYNKTHIFNLIIDGKEAGQEVYVFFIFFYIS